MGARYINNNKRKKILIIGHTNTMGGVETFIKNTTLYSNKERIQYEYMIHGTDKCLFQEEITNFYGRNVFHFIPCFRLEPCKTISALKQFYREHNDYDYIHLQTGAASEVVYAYPYCKKYNISLIIHSHNGGNLRAAISHQLFVPLINKIVDKRLTCSRVAGIYMFGNKMGQKATIVPVGIDTERFKFSEVKRMKFRERYGIHNDTYIIGVIGRFTVQKNQLFAIEIFSEMLKYLPNSLLILKGEGELEGELREAVNSRKLSNRVMFINRIQNIEDLYCGLDVFLMPSLFEGFPQVAIEAQTCGLPCIFSDRITDEVNVTVHNKFLGLEQQQNSWVKALVSCKGININERTQGYYDVKNANYDIHDTIKILENIYYN